MKKYLLPFVTFLFINNAFTQNTFPTTTGSKVGIGTTSPQTRLDFRGDNQSISVTGNSFNYASTGTQFPIGAKFGYWTSTGAAGINFHRWLGGGTLFHTAYIGQALNGVNDYGLDFRTENKTTFGDATISRMFISAIDGNVGIGTQTPTSKLEIKSGIANTSGLKFTNINSTSNPTTTNVAPLGIDNYGNVVVSTNSTLPQSVIYLSSFSNFDSAISSLNALPNVFTLVIDKNGTLNSATATIEKTKTIKFLKGNVISIPIGTTLTINGAIDAGVYQIFNCIGSGKTDGLPQIEQVYPQWWKTYSTDPTSDWSDSIQRAVNFYPKVFFPSNNYYINITISLDLGLSGHILQGVGAQSNFTFRNGNDYAFKSSNIQNGGFQSILTIENLSFTCKKAINFCGGDSDNEFENENKAILNVNINKCRFVYYNHPIHDYGIENSNAIAFKKVFDSRITNNYIEGYEIGVKLEGSDINTISDNRITHFNEYAILDLSYNTYGSENNIFHNDLLMYTGDASSGAFIKSSSHHIMIKDNYLENPTPGGSGSSKIKTFIDCSNSGLTNLTDNSYPKNIDIRGNRIDAHPGSTDNIYLIQDRFSSLILDGHRTTNDTDFPSYFINSAGVPLSYLGSRFNDLCEREIHISSCISFREWNNFNSSNKFTNSSDGTLIIDSKNVSTSIRIDGSPTEVKQFNPLKFKLDATKVYRVNLSQGILNGETELYKNVKFRIILKGTSSSQNGTLLIRADDSDSVINPVAYYNTPTLTNDYSIIEYTPNLQSFAKYLFIVSENDIEIKQIEIVPIITPITNKLSKNEEQTINEKFEILEKKLDLLINELEILKSDSNNIGSNEEIKIFPNPVGDDLSITFSSENSVAFEFSVYDLSGKQVIFEKINYKSKTYHIDFSNLITESYIYKIKSDKYLKTGVIIKK